MAYAKLRPRRGSLYEWESTDPVLAEGELVIEVPDSGVGTGLCRFKIGDGYKKYSELPYAFDGSIASAIYGGDVYNWNDICIRTGTTDEWETDNPVLKLGEFGYNVSKQRLKIGDGISTWDQLKYIGSFVMDDVYDFGDEDEEDNDPDSEIFDFGDHDDPYSWIELESKCNCNACNPGANNVRLENGNYALMENGMPMAVEGSKETHKS